MGSTVSSSALPAFYASVGNHLRRYAAGPDGIALELAFPELPQNIQFACFHAQQPIKYVACSNGGVASQGDEHRLVKVGLAKDSLAVLEAPVPLPSRPLHLMVDPAGRKLSLAYNRPAAISFHESDAAGLMLPGVALHDGVELVGHFPHEIQPLLGQPVWLLASRGDDATPSNAEHPGSLRLLRHDLGVVSAVQIVSPGGGVGFGPRNCAFHPKLPILYYVLGRQNLLVAFRFVNGVLKEHPRWSVDLLKHPEQLCRPQLGGAIVVHPTGRFAYVVNRAHPAQPHGVTLDRCGENSVVAFDLDASTGEPRELQREDLPGVHARCLSLSNNGRLLVAAIRQRSALPSGPQGALERPAGFTCFAVDDAGGLSFVRHHPVDVGDEQLFWAAFAPPSAHAVGATLSDLSRCWRWPPRRWPTKPLASTPSPVATLRPIGSPPRCVLPASSRKANSFKPHLGRHDSWSGGSLGLQPSATAFAGSAGLVPPALPSLAHFTAHREA